MSTRFGLCPLQQWQLSPKSMLACAPFLFIVVLMRVTLSILPSVRHKLRFRCGQHLRLSSGSRAADMVPDILISPRRSTRALPNIRGRLLSLSKSAMKRGNGAPAPATLPRLLNRVSFAGVAPQTSHVLVPSCLVRFRPKVSEKRPDAASFIPSFSFGLSCTGAWSTRLPCLQQVEPHPFHKTPVATPLLHLPIPAGLLVRLDSFYRNGRQH